MTSPPPPRQDPLAIPNIIRIPLEHHQAQMLAGLGEMFVVITQASYPNQPGLGMLVLPISKELAADACNIVLGSHRATKIKTAVSERRATTPPPRTP